MRLSESRLRQIIREEVKRSMLSEGNEYSQIPVHAIAAAFKKTGDDTSASILTKHDPGREQYLYCRELGDGTFRAYWTKPDAKGDGGQLYDNISSEVITLAKKLSNQ
jgi:hypothetical protein